MNAFGTISPFKVDPSRGEHNSRVASEWFSRPADERYLDLDTLFESVSRRAECSRSRTVESREVRVQASPNAADALAVILPGSDTPLMPTHWSFGQLCSLVGAPAGYLRDMPATLAGINLQYGLSCHRPEQVKILELDDGRHELRAATGPKTRETDFALDGRWHDGSCQVLPPVDGTQKIANPAGGSTGPPG